MVFELIWEVIVGLRDSVVMFLYVFGIYRYFGVFVF